MNDLKDLKAISDDVHRLVHEQDKFFEESEANVMRANESVEAGLPQLELVCSSFGLNFALNLIHLTISDSKYDTILR